MTLNTDITDLKWHTLSSSEVTSQLNVDPGLGLKRSEARHRLHQFGFNEIKEKERRPIWFLIFDQFRDFMIIILLVASIISGIIGELLDTMAILVIVILNATIGAVQEYRAARAIAALKAISTPNTSVLREMERQTISSTRLVPGDIVFIETGVLIPADMRLIETTSLEINEAVLTGESVPINKNCEVISDTDTPISEQSNMVFKGTQVNRGRAIAVVVGTGMETEIGRIASILQTTPDLKTPLQKRLVDFGRRLALAIIAICIVIFAAGLLQGVPWMLMFLTAISLAVAAIPEALPAVVNISLALGARKMSKQQALIRNLPAVETLGSITYICADKTGTLTQNRMTLDCLYANNQLYESMPDKYLPLWQEIGRALAISNNAVISDHQIGGSPTEVAFYEAAEKSGYKKSELEVQYPRITEFPFDSDRKRMATLHQSGSGLILYVKGAPEHVLDLCNKTFTEHGPVPLDKEKLLGEADKLAKEGYRVLGLATRQFSHEVPHDPGSIEQDLIFLALLALIDPPRDEVPLAVSECKSAGIRPVMITGDHPATALAIAHRVGIVDSDHRVLTGKDLDLLTEKELDLQVRQTQVYARVTPEQKIRIVEALQNAGEFCAMTGDGINDAPALKRADIGVAMGQKGTDVARESADMILMDDNFATIVNAVREGRRIFDNIRKFIRYAMTTNSGEIWTLLLAPFLGLPIPLLPIHILWINLVTDGLPGLALTMEAAERGIMQRPPRPPNEHIFVHGMWQHILWVGLLIGGVSLLSQAWAIHFSNAHWQTMVFTVLTFAQLAQVMAIRSETESLLSVGLFTNKPLIGAISLTVGLQLCVIYIPFLNEIFKTSPLEFYELLICILLSLVIFISIEIEKWLVRRALIYQQ